MNFTKFNLLLSSVLIIILYFEMPFYNRWLQTKALSPNNDMFDQMQNLDIEYRNQYRFGSTYMFDKNLQHTLSTHSGVTVLLPTNAYMKTVNIKGLDLQEPAVFYYFTGINSVWANSPKAETANWALWADKKSGMHLIQIKTKNELDSILSVYKKYTN